ncbi:MAG: Asp23/Gls24 family envelope stress response protein [Chlamydiales bacterium]|nr:Asp23/Gls24 family envelope stress response protein [Chlamydiales bacterium]
MQNLLKKIDAKEFELPETVFVRDIENRVFQSIVLETVSRIEGVACVEGNIIDALLGREITDHLKGIYVEQQEKSPSVRIKVEVNVAYGVSLPEKAEEIQTVVSRKISELTGVHVSSVHVVFKNLIFSAGEKGE